MDLLATLAELQDISKKEGFPELFCCGGLPRDFLLEEKENIEDVDLMNGSNTIHDLAKIYGEHVQKLGGDYRVLKDGHAQIQFEGIKLDFSSNFVLPDIKKMLAKVGVKKPSGLLLEQESRDFTCNSLLMSTNLKTISDPTGLGINDIKKELIRTCLPAKITLGVDNKRVVRIIYLAAKLGFNVDKEIINWVKANPKSISNVKPKYLAQKLQKACDYDIVKTAALISEMGLWNEVPILPDLMPYASKGLVTNV